MSDNELLDLIDNLEQAAFEAGGIDGDSYAAIGASNEVEEAREKLYQHCAALLARIAELEAAQRWIPVDQPPTETGWYPTWQNSRSEPMALQEDCWYSESFNLWQVDDGYSVVFWHNPLPPAPVQ